MDLNQTVDSLYETIVEQNGLQGVTGILARAMPGSAVAMQLYDARTNQCHGVAETGFDPGSREAYFEHYAPLNPWARVFVQGKPDQVLRAEETVAREDLLSGEYYNDWLRPQGDLSLALGLVLNRWDTQRLILTTRLGEGQDDVLASCSQTLHQLMPHLNRVSQIEALLSESRDARAFMKAGFQSMRGCAVLVNGSGRVIAASMAAEELFERRTLFRINMNNNLAGASLSIDGTFRSLLGDLAQLDDITGPIVVRDENRNAAAALITIPVHPDYDGVKGALLRGATDRHQPAKLVVVIEPDQLALPSLDLLKAFFDLSTCEAQLALAVSEGVTLSDYARKKDLSRNTVRNHLANIFTKTGVNRQVDLVRMLGALGEAQSSQDQL
ncbi:helix-turn-helix transcriptional regulator [Coralliovum pocilloporae]|uniref:helix-turn-helix transcriptional regulator n=1 Tax=Coralliovum pocilloporae TaxID=3066369 RepID=UPI003306B52C